MMHKHLSPDEVYPQISSSLRFVSPLPCSSYITVYYFIDSLDKCHTSFLNALIFSKDHLLSKYLQVNLQLFVLPCLLSARQPVVYSTNTVRCMLFKKEMLHKL